MKKDSARGNTSEINVIMKFNSVICVPFGSGMLMYADTHKIAAKSAIMTME
ncbi:MAG: hypothetical protein PUG10_04895 [Lachnospiraceae bacterium]|nr:hypothetical protein [Lachnospiraceae bacterium]